MATLNVKKFPDDVYEQLQAIAEREHRSVAQQVIHLLAAAVRDHEPRSILELDGLGKSLWLARPATEHVAAERDSWEQGDPDAT